MLGGRCQPFKSLLNIKPTANLLLSCIVLVSVVINYTLTADFMLALRCSLSKLHNIFLEKVYLFVFGMIFVLEVNKALFLLS